MCPQCKVLVSTAAGIPTRRRLPLPRAQNKRSLGRRGLPRWHRAEAPNPPCSVVAIQIRRVRILGVVPALGVPLRGGRAAACFTSCPPPAPSNSSAATLTAYPCAATKPSYFISSSQAIANDCWRAAGRCNARMKQRDADKKSYKLTLHRTG
jgi:hypothetical protein